MWINCKLVNLMVVKKIHLIFWGSSSDYKMIDNWQICCRNGETKKTTSNFWFSNYEGADFGRATVMRNKC